MGAILIIRSSAMGDIVMASPMIKALKDACPAGRLYWLAEPHFAPLLRDNPLVDGVILFEKGRWRTLFRERKFLTLVREIVALRRKLRDLSLDLALDVQGLFRSRALAWLSGARHRVGLKSREPGFFFMTGMVEKGGKSKLMSSEYCHLLTVLGLDGGGALPDVRISTHDEQTAREQLVKSGVTAPFTVIAPFTTRPQKHWFDERWTELAGAIRDRVGHRVVMLGGPADREHGARIADASQGGIVNLAGQLSLMQSAAVIKQAAALVGVDTGLTHMGTAFRRPTVALFGATRPYLETASPLTRVLYHPFPCSPCRRSPVCSGEFPCMADLTVAEIIDHLCQLLALKAEDQ